MGIAGKLQWSGYMDPKLALAHYKKVDPILYQATKKFGHAVKVRTPLRTNQKLFEALCESVVSQQLAVKAADAIWARVVSVCGGKVTPVSVQKARLTSLRKAGLSGAKAKTLKAIAEEIQKKGLNLHALKKKTPEDAERELTKIWGVGPWTSDMFLLFALGHPDIFSERDLGLVRSMENLYKLPRTTPLSKLEKIAERWSPHRSYACLILWKARDTKNP